jgi:putative flippase GtrA
MKLPVGEPLRFLIAGGCNTIFGIADTLLMTWLFIHLLPSRTVLMTSVAMAISTVINITVSFLSYKIFVFRAHGHYIEEYLRSLLVYLPALVISTTAVAPLTILLRHLLTRPLLAPYVAQGGVVLFSMVTSFLGHKHITFRKKTVERTETNDEQS